MRNWKQHIPSQGPEEILDAGQTGFALLRNGPGWGYAELETAYTQPGPRGNTGCRADRICSAEKRAGLGICGTGIGEKKC